MSIESVTPSNHLILYGCLLLPPSIFKLYRLLKSQKKEGEKIRMNRKYIIRFMDVCAFKVFKNTLKCWGREDGVWKERGYSCHLKSFLFLYLIVPAPRYGMWGLSSTTRDWIQAPTLEAQSPSHWTTKEVPHLFLESSFLHNFSTLY